MEQQKYVAYLRRSKKDTVSTLGIEAQQAEVERYAYHNNGKIIYHYVEIESGTSLRLVRRIEIWKAIEHCKRENAILIIAKLDRLARDVEFTSRLLNAGVRFVACDIPSANEFTIHVMAAVAEQEAKRISERTKAALEAKRKRGEPLGIYTHKKPYVINDEARKKAKKQLRAQRENNVNNRVARGYAFKLKQEGKSLQVIAKEMQDQGYKSPRGKILTPATIQRWLEQFKESDLYLMRK
jgi:DNA invertase Pin-like site-specific DNA recombinase